MKRLLVSLIAAALLLSGCGGGDDNPADGEQSGSASSATSDAASDTTAEGGAGTTAAGGEGEEHSGEHDHESADFPAAEATQVVKISMRDYAFIDMPASVTGPRLRIEGKNNGPSAHEMIVFDADGNEVGGVKPFLSGESKPLSLELTAGAYEMRCQIAITETETHADRGMRVTFAVM
jgi:uncharacterized protein YceK